MVRIVVADDQPLVRGGIQAMLDAQLGFEVVGLASDGDEAVRLAAEQQPDVVVMDMRMPGLDGAGATRRLTQDTGTPDRLVKVLVLTTFDDRETLYDALLSGASGFLLKDNAPAWLVDAVRAVADGHAWLDPTTGAHMIEALNATPRLGLTNSDRLAHLTAREREVLVLMARGMSNAEICSEFVLSTATVRTHVARILMKTGCRDRSQAVALAYQSRLVAGEGLTRERAGALEVERTPGEVICPNRHTPPAASYSWGVTGDSVAVTPGRAARFSRLGRGRSGGGRVGCGRTAGCAGAGYLSSLRPL